MEQKRDQVVQSRIEQASVTPTGEQFFSSRFNRGYSREIQSLRELCQSEGNKMLKVLRRLRRRFQGESSDRGISPGRSHAKATEPGPNNETAAQQSTSEAAGGEGNTILPTGTTYLKLLREEVRSRSAHPSVDSDLDYDDLRLVFDSEDEDDEETAEFLWKDVFQPLCIFELLQKANNQESSLNQNCK